MSAAALSGTVMVMAGGTGGHVHPALAVANALREGGARVVWLGTPRGLEARSVPRAGFELELLRVSGLRGRGWPGRLVAAGRLAVALAQALVLVLRVRPRLVVGFGGYASGPGGAAARLLGRRLVVHEQNAVPGLTNRLLGRVASRVLEAFPGSFPTSYRARHTGNPVHLGVCAVPAPRGRLAERSGALRLLVVGGSQGASALNGAVPAALAMVPASVAEVLHLSGEAELEATRQRYQAAGIAARVRAFTDDMAGAYAWADLVVCRAGAMTVSELAAAGVASVLVPYPHAVDDHQSANAGYLVAAGAAMLLPESELTPGRLGAVLEELCGARERLVAMAVAARRLGIPDATERVLRECVEVAGG